MNIQIYYIFYFFYGIFFLYLYTKYIGVQDGI